MGVPSFGVTKPLNTPVWQASKGDVTSASELARAADDAASKIYTTKRWSNRHKRGSEVYPDVSSFTLFVIWTPPFYLPLKFRIIRWFC